VWGLDENYETQSGTQQNLEELVEERDSKHYFYLVSIGVVTLTAAIFALGIGSSESLGFWKTTRIILQLDEPTDIQSAILLEIRLPRILMAIFAGTALATAGALMQGSLGNPLVSPLTLGVASGASLGAALAIILGFSVIANVIPNTILVANTFAFSLIVVFIILKLGQVRGVSAESYILVGIAITFIAGAIVSTLTYFATDQQLAQLTHWSFGSVSRPNLVTVLWVGIILGAIFPRLMNYSWDLNTLALGGDDFAISTGVDPAAVRKNILIISALITSLIIAFTGLIGFVGLAAPHIGRLVIGNDYRKLIPCSALIGALLVLIADTIGRTIVAPIVIPVGVMLSILGGPFFLYLLLARRSERYG
jgi:iron complex transport system permease protein